MRWTKGKFTVEWQPSKQRYVITKGYNKIRVVYAWRDAKPYLD